LSTTHAAPRAAAAPPRARCCRRWRGLLLRCVLLLLGCACALDVVKLYSRLTQTRLCPRLLCCGC
jgi:hypothetical protein